MWKKHIQHIQLLYSLSLYILKYLGGLYPSNLGPAWGLLLHYHGDHSYLHPAHLL